MNLGTAVYEMLSSNSGVTSIVGNGIYPIVAPMEAEPTFIVYSIIDSGNWSTKDKPYPITDYSLQVDVYAKTALELYNTASKVRAALDQQSGEYGDVCLFCSVYKKEFDGYDSVDLLYRKTIEFNFIVNNN
jgi:hypothetical protein